MLLVHPLGFLGAYAEDQQPMWHRVHGFNKTCNVCRETSEAWVLLIESEVHMRAMFCPTCHRQLADLVRRPPSPIQTAQGDWSEGGRTP